MNFENVFLCIGEIVIDTLSRPPNLQMATKGRANVKVKQRCWGTSTRHEAKTQVGLVDLSAGVSKSSKNGVFYKSSYLRFEFFISMQN